MKKLNHFHLLLLFIFLIGGVPEILTAQEQNESSFKPFNIQAAHQVFVRLLGEKKANCFVFKRGFPSDSNSTYRVISTNGKVVITANTTEALCRGGYDFLKNGCHSQVCWSGKRILFPDKLPQYSNRVESPFKYHYYMNIVTHGYSSPYWDWARWEKEIDWMALHGINMPLISGAYEAIIFRTFKKMGLSNEEIAAYFTGPAYFPWNRMGNITGWQGHFPDSYFEKQVALSHKILNRLRELGMQPIVPAFAGFVPEGIKRLYPEVSLRQLNWGEFDPKYQAVILPPDSKLFREIGASYIREWEKEFGKNKFYLADSFNEMDVPLSNDKDKALDELSMFGSSVYQSITDGDPDAVWVMQGWTFPYFRVKNELFWTPERLNALCSKVPDNKLLILDLANEYNRLIWNIDPSWKIYDGFFGKMWIYSFIPNMGGKVPYNGKLDLYSTMPYEMLSFKNRKNLVGFGFAPEGIENNEVIYELLSDIGWSGKSISIDTWLRNYCLQRYGCNSIKMMSAWQLLRKSCYGSFSDCPRYIYQLRPSDPKEKSVFSSVDFFEAVRLFVDCSKDCSKSQLYVNDAIELAVQYLGLVADEKLDAFEKDQSNRQPFDEAMVLLDKIDRLLASHPNHQLSQWVNYARKWGNTKQESDYYESDARRLITTWGGDVNEYSARTWSGMVHDYYKERWMKYYASADKGDKDKLKQWEEHWIQTPWKNRTIKFADPLKEIKILLREYPHK